MLKKALIYVFVCLLFGINSMTAFAVEKNLPDGFCIDDGNGISVDGAGEYFIYVDDFDKNDSITRTLTVRNLETDSFKLYLTAEPVDATGAVDWLDNLHLKITLDGRLMYGGRLRGDGKGTKTLTGNNVDMIHSMLALGRYAEGDYGVVKFEITVDADHLDYWTLSEKSKADIKWVFTAINDEDPKDEDPKGNDQEDEDPKGKGDSAKVPKTGEAVRYSLYVFLLVTLAISAIILYRYRKLRDNDAK